MTDVLPEPAARPTAPKCARCRQVVSVAVGLPVFVTFNADGSVATVGVDLSELGDLNPGDVRCGCSEPGGADLAPELDDNAYTDLLEVLHDIAANVAPSVDYEMGSR